MASKLLQFRGKMLEILNGGVEVKQHFIYIRIWTKSVQENTSTWSQIANIESILHDFSLANGTKSLKLYEYYIWTSEEANGTTMKY